LNNTAAPENHDPTRTFWWDQIPNGLRKLIKFIAALTFLFTSIGALFAAIVGAKDGWGKVQLMISNAFTQEQLPPRSPTPPGTTSREPPSPQIVQGAFEGYVYYEVSRDGKPTSDGRLVPIGTSTMPNFEGIKVGDRFRILDAINVRANPNPNNDWNNSGYFTQVGTLGSKQCVQVVDGERRKYQVQIARSGGWLPIVAIACP
jgi:hypothetical protein